MKLGFVSVFVLAFLMLMVLNSPSTAMSYKHLTNDYFEVEYPSNWEIIQRNKGNTMEFVFSIPHYSEKEEWTSIQTCRLLFEPKGMVSLQLGINPQQEGMEWNKDGSINEALMHFFQTFKVNRLRPGFV